MNTNIYTVSFTSLIVAQLFLNSSNFAHSQPAIIDHAFRTSEYVEKLKSRGTKVIGRYYARCVGEGQWSDKRMSAQEVKTLTKSGFSMLSVYQYWNNSHHKFSGLREKRLKDSNGKEKIVLVPTLNAACDAETKVGRSAAQEAKLDAEAAVKQAQAVGQPANKGTAIYFGVDFDFPNKASSRQKATENMIIYFEIVKSILNTAGYEVGSYGSGYAHEKLLEAGLVKYTWLSPSPAHRRSVEFFNSGKWSLFQSSVDVGWHKDGACKSGSGNVDTNVQNPSFNEYIGLWNLDGPVTVSSAVTQKSYDSMQFVCDSKAIIRKQNGQKTTATICKRGKFTTYKVVPHGATVTLGENIGDLVEFDLDHDGKIDGWTKTSNLSGTLSNRPKWKNWAPKTCN